MYIWWFLKFGDCFCGKHTENPHHSNKTDACNHPYVVRHEHHHWGIGVPAYTVGSAIKVRPVPTTDLRLSSVGDYRLPIGFNGRLPTLSSSIMVHKFAIYVHRIRLRQNDLIFDETQTNPLRNLDEIFGRRISFDYTFCRIRGTPSPWQS